MQAVHESRCRRTRGKRWSGAALALLLAGCASAGAVGDTDAVAFPDPAKAYPAGGTYPDLDDLRLFALGMSKAQVQALLGTPHFNEGLWGVQHWNYLFNFRKAIGDTDVVVCQFQVGFEQGVATAAHWKPQACASLINPPPPPKPAPAPLPKEPLRLSADALFEFDSAELTAQGRASLDGLQERIRSASQVQDIRVAGYADRIGGDAYNYDLSLRRAQAVVDYLVAGGVPVAAIHAEGHGENDPVVDCPGEVSPAVIACLAPNRRVEISGQALR